MTSPDVAAFEALTAQLHHDLQPGTTLETIIFKELARASWRLELCARAEDASRDEAEQAAIDRTRTTALNIVMKAITELRRLQTNRIIGVETSLHTAEIPHRGLANHREIIAAHAANERRLTVKDRVEPADHNPAPAPGPVAVPAPSRDSSFCKTPESPANPPVPRRSPCPCKSGERYKNCCGKNAPPVLHHGARPKAA